MIRAIIFDFISVVSITQILLIIDNNVDIEISDTPFGCTALFLAVQNNNESCAIFYCYIAPSLIELVLLMSYINHFNMQLIGRIYNLLKHCYFHKADPNALTGFLKQPILVKIIDDEDFSLEFKKQAILLLLKFDAKKSYTQETQTKLLVYLNMRATKDFINLLILFKIIARKYRV